ncbi:MAG: hypothetical protein GF334_08065 [Candidatus Altiarchaeales archaeon]|nr:hypothetical protein [Candidatus Altiarchaeales archaeon]
MDTVIKLSEEEVNYIWLLTALDALRLDMELDNQLKVTQYRIRHSIRKKLFEGLERSDAVAQLLEKHQRSFNLEVQRMPDIITTEEIIQRIEADGREILGITMFEDGETFITFENEDDNPDDVQVGRLIESEDDVAKLIRFCHLTRTALTWVGRSTLEDPNE